MYYGDISGMEGTYLHRWQVTMTDGSLINQTGYIELAGQNSNDTIQPFTISPLAGILGIGLITLPLMTQFLMLPISFSSLSVEGARLKREASKRWLPIAGLAVIGLASGLLMTPLLAVATFAGLAGLAWATAEL